MENQEIKELYSLMFTNYPDVVEIEQLAEMLGGVCIKTVYRLLQSGKIRSLHIGKRYKIPKVFIIQYLTNAANQAPRIRHRCSR